MGRALFGEVQKVPTAVVVLQDAQRAMFKLAGGDFWSLLKDGPQVDFQAQAFCLHHGILVQAHNGEVVEVHADVGKPIPPRQVDPLRDELAVQLFVEGLQSLFLPAFGLRPDDDPNHAQQQPQQAGQNQQIRGQSAQA